MRLSVKFPGVEPGVVLLLGLLISVASPLWAKHKDDVVVLKNGDRITGEIKSLQNAILYIKPAYVVDTFGINWADIERVESQDRYTWVFTDGRRYTGTISKTKATEETHDFVISEAGRSVSVPQKEMVTVRPVEDGFWKQLTGSIDFGFNYTQGANNTQSTLSASTDYRQERYTFHVDGSSVFSGQSNGNSTARYTFNTNYNRYFSRNWYAGTVANFLRSDQQELDFRATAGGGIGHDFLRTNRTNLSGIGGAVFTRERYAPAPGQEPHSSNAEALLGMNFYTYRFKLAEINSQVSIYPSLSNLGRLRLGTQSSISFQIISNLYWKFSAYENFDSKPPINAPKNDVGLSTSLGWKF
jgi:hypothetical protein